MATSRRNSAGVEHDFVDDHGRVRTFSFPGSQGTIFDFISNKGLLTAGTFFDAATVGRGFLLTGGEFTEINEPNANAVRFEGRYAAAMDKQGNKVAGGYWDQSGTLHGWIGAF